MTFDVIVIGSGLGGLVAGAKLAKEGKKILLLEQESTPGGYASCFILNDYIIDLGLHAIDGMYERDPKIEIFEDLDVFFNVEFEKIPTGFYRFTNKRKDFIVPDSAEEAITSLTEQFPEEEKGIKKFFKTINTLTKHTHSIPRSKFLQAIVGPFVPILFSSIPQWGGKTAGELFDKYFKNEDLKLALAGTIQYYGDDPYKLSAIIFALALSSRFKAGTHYIKGGSVKLSYSLANFIIEHGGTILFNRRATNIIVKRGRAVGVEYVSTKRKAGKVNRVDAKYIVSNASVPQVVNDLLPEKVNKKFRQQINKADVGHSILNVFLGFKKSLKELGNTSYTTVVNNEGVINLADVSTNHKSDYEKRNFIFVDYSQIDSRLAPSGKSTGVISTVDYLENWKDLSKNEYIEKKKEIAYIFIRRLSELIPDLVQHIEYFYVSTPRTKYEYTLNPQGTLLGFAYTIKQSGMNRLKSKSPIKNLYFSSAWTFPGGGFSSTIWAGWQCAEQLLKKL
ncbi:MAG: NAD(P)/FAD-dependent oxidoreductase [Candidatus Heimdallarchaeota archaeon]|nr:NAD(P)/FAD-dependent oxidoreductase [Candidatus Heimdallarchaeota archaeon]MCK4954485.1 NAD(P)/FAD-dependent oxidoreductase [Candidatus Heimdallarchaeota archaeon]